jgi:hypothetical protein
LAYCEEEIVMAYESELLHELEDEYSGEGEDELEGEYEDESSLEGEGWLGAIGNIAGSLLGEGEDEYEEESAFEAEDELSPIRKIYPDAMMEHLGELAFEAETEDEAAEHFLPLIGMAASKLLPVVARAVMPAAKKALPRIARAVTKATPHLTKSIGRVVKTLHRNPQTRHLVKVVPAIARRTVGTIARQAAHGRHITPRAAVKTLTKQARHVLVHPGHRRHALRYHGQLERKFHRYHGQGIPRRHGWGAHHHHPSDVRYVGGAPRYAGAPNYAAHAATGYVAPGVAYHPAAPLSAGGQVRYGQCTCAPCPSCGGKVA